MLSVASGFSMTIRLTRYVNAHTAPRQMELWAAASCGRPEPTSTLSFTIWYLQIGAFIHGHKHTTLWLVCVYVRAYVVGWLYVLIFLHNIQAGTLCTDIRHAPTLFLSTTPLTTHPIILFLLLSSSIIHRLSLSLLHMEAPVWIHIYTRIHPHMITNRSILHACTHARKRETKDHLGTAEATTESISPEERRGLFFFLVGVLKISRTPLAEGRNEREVEG